MCVRLCVSVYVRVCVHACVSVYDIQYLLNKAQLFINDHINTKNSFSKEMFS